MTPALKTDPKKLRRSSVPKESFYGALIFGAICGLVLVASGCTKNGAQPLGEPLATEAKPRDSTPSTLPVTEPIRLTPAEERDLIKIREWSQSHYVFTEADRESLRDLGPIPAPGSTKEAYLVLGFVRVVLARGVGPSLENYGRVYRIPVADALKDNLYLKGVEPARRVVESLQKIPVSEAFFAQVTAALRVQGASWDKGGPSVDSVIPPPPGSLAIPFAPAAAGGVSPLSPTSQSQALGASGGGVSDQGLLDLGQQLADSGLFTEAILKVQQVGDQSPLKILAIQRIKDYSQSGIQDLRRKARTAFQSASVAADDRSRTEYLKSARQFLEDALVLYPDAPQASTVKENLKAISLQIKQSASR